MRKWKGRRERGAKAEKEINVATRPRLLNLSSPLVTSCHILSNLVTSPHLLSHLVTSCPHLLSHLVTSCHILSPLVTSCHILSHLVTSCHILSHLVTSCHILSPLVTSCHLLSHLVTSCPSGGFHFHLPAKRPNFDIKELQVRERSPLSLVPELSASRHLFFKVSSPLLQVEVFISIVQVKN